MAPTIFSGFRLALTYILKSVLGLEYVAQVGGVGMWLSDAAYKFEVEEVYAGPLRHDLSLDTFSLRDQSCRIMDPEIAIDRKNLGADAGWKLPPNAQRTGPDRVADDRRVGGDRSEPVFCFLSFFRPC